VKITSSNLQSCAMLRAGVGTKYKWLFFKVAAKIPVVLDTNGRNIDPNIGGGLEIKRFFAGYFYGITAFDNNERGRTAIIASYGMIGYRF